jgi:hypothetical protein
MVGSLGYSPPIIADEELCSADSIQDGSVAVFTPHCAFQDPTAAEDAPMRQSIELRALVFYD